MRVLVEHNDNVPIKAHAMHTSLPFAFPTQAPTFVVFRPWSHTDRRQMLAIMEGPFSSIDEATRALPRHETYARAQVGTIFPIGTFTDTSEEALEVDTTTTPPHTEMLSCIAISWTARTPGKLRAESRPLRSGAKAQGWAEFCTELREHAGRRFGVLRAEGPIAATFSP
jgi:hypothetical protein